ncbi:hypothetical protein [Nocardioides sp. SYSU D00065]|uniref:hypothetical protein n=1 Tax=Nocardioides sp. SYSU D00065 TaxID=2817378 RepID=UPI001B328753|nr:hypothetical protein [Nocardioides sp. SYSU D00065]
MSGKRHLVAVLVRLAALGIALAAYTTLVVPSMSDAGDADIGAGLVAFAALALAGFGGALLDARRHGARTALAWWLAVAAGLAVGWWGALAMPQDASASFGELLARDAGLLPFTFALLAIPAALGAALGRALPARG